ncbi:MAG: hypothetical protein JWL80_634 [Parcubacteria group bacterium]|nr:hypothetical protein [Parcubacteria group bacterium]
MYWGGGAAVVVILIGIGLFYRPHASQTSDTATATPIVQRETPTETFTKDPNETFVAALRRVILKNYPSKECKIETQEDPKGTFTSAYIAYPESDTPGQNWYVHAELCNPKYAANTSIRYFMYYKDTPDKFYFFEKTPDEL